MKGRREPNWHPISTPPIIENAITGELESARVCGDSFAWCGVYDEQLRRWRSEALAAAQRRDVTRVENTNRETPTVVTAILGLAEELSAGTIERQLGKTDEQLGLEYLPGLHSPPLTLLGS